MKKELRTMPTLLLVVLCAISIFTTLYLFFEARSQYAAAKEWQTTVVTTQNKLDEVTTDRNLLADRVDELSSSNDTLTKKVKQQSNQIDQLNKELSDKTKALEEATKKPVVVTKPAPPKKKKRIPYDIAPSQQ